MKFLDDLQKANVNIFAANSSKYLEFLLPGDELKRSKIVLDLLFSGIKLPEHPAF